MKTRVGSVPYVNALPLYQSLLTLGNPDMTLIFEVPTKLSQELTGGLLQAALCPAIKCLSDDYEILPSHGIISRGAVGSIHLYSSKDPKDWQTIAADSASISSASLVQVLCRHHFKNQASLVKSDKETADAYFLIGDADLKHQKETNIPSWDLGSEWKKFTGLPFLYAAWVVRTTVSQEIKTFLDESYLDPNHEEVINALKHFSSTMEMPLTDLSSYLTTNIFYKIDDEVLEGFRTFINYFSELKGLKNNSVRLATLHG